MRQNSTNTFNQGINFDLNPLTTPNNLLTDCVNGTFITFNGDELVLQNDAGNTKIELTDDAKTSDDDPDYVQLDDGYYPIGMKEYGGVLYIVSAYTSDDESVEFEEDEEYSTGDVVYNSVGNYYESLIDNNDNSLPLDDDTDDNWKLIGDESDYINTISNIQFGSYPSPEASGVTTYSGIDVSKSSTGDLEDYLYTSIVLNDYKFKSGRYIVFDSNNSSNLTNVSCYNDSGDYDPRFYKVKLLHKLNNGSIDLTSDVWDTYLDNLGSNYADKYWFNDGDFKYYCPNQYKGKLATQIEIENLAEFSLYSSEVTEADNDYTLSFTMYKEDYGYVYCTGATAEIYISGELVSTLTSSFSSDYANFTYARTSISLTNTIIKVVITPIITFDSSIVTMPDDWVDNHTITIKKLLGSSAGSIKFSSAEIECGDTFGYGNTIIYILKDSDGNNLDNNLLTTTSNYCFVESGINLSSYLTGYSIATYDIDDEGYPVINTTNLDIDDYVLELFTTEYTQVSSDDCGYYIAISDTEDLYINSSDKLEGNL